MHYQSGQTGKSVTLTYLPNGKIYNAILLERYCYHGDLGNTHVNPDGTISNKDGSKTMVYGGCTTLKSGVVVVVPAGSIINENGSIKIEE